MPELYTFDYAIIRVVPRVEREEFMNVGVILSCPDKQFLKTRLDLNVQRLAAFAPTLDAETIKGYLNTFSIISDGGIEAGAIGQLPQRSRFHWLVAPRSTIIQTSQAHSGFCADPEAALEHLLEKMVRLN